MIDDPVTEFRRQMTLRDGHAHRRGQPLPQRPGGDFHPAGQPEFGMPGSLRAELAEGLQLIKRHVLVAQQVQKGIEHGRAMPRRKHEAVTIRPARILGVKCHEFGEKRRDDIGGPQRDARMA